MRIGLFVLLVTFGAVTHAQPSAPRATVVEDLRIGPGKNDLGSLVEFFIVTPTGTMVIGDSYDFEVSYFSATGKRIGNVGRKGEGPGEFHAVNGTRGPRANFLGGLIGDSVWIYDWMTRRTTFTSADGRFLSASIMPATIPGIGTPPTVSSTPRLVFFAPDAMYADGSMLGTGMFRASPPRNANYHLAPGALSSRAEMLLMAKDGQSHRSLAAKPPAGATVRVPNPPGASPRESEWLVPMAPRSMEAVAADGNRFAFLTQQLNSPRGATFSLTVIGQRGDTLVSRTYPLAGMPVTKAAAENALQTVTNELRAKGPGGSASRYSDKLIGEIRSRLAAVMPKIQSPIQNLYLGVDNSIWLVLKHDDKKRIRWLVLDAKGNPWREVLTPNGVRVTSMSAVWGFDWNDDGEPSIVRYRVVPVALK